MRPRRTSLRLRAILCVASKTTALGESARLCKQRIFWSGALKTRATETWGGRRALAVSRDSCRIGATLFADWMSVRRRERPRNSASCLLRHTSCAGPAANLVASLFCVAGKKRFPTPNERSVVRVVPSAAGRIVVQLCRGGATPACRLAHAKKLCSSSRRPRATREHTYSRRPRGRNVRTLPARTVRACRWWRRVFPCKGEGGAAPPAPCGVPTLRPASDVVVPGETRPPMSSRSPGISRCGGSTPLVGALAEQNGEEGRAAPRGTRLTFARGHDARAVPCNARVEFACKF